MNDRTKLLPAVAMAMMLLFGLKSISLWAGLSTAFSSRAMAQDAADPAGGAGDGDADLTPDDAADATADETATAKNAALSATERAVLETLADRRQALDAREREIDTREKLLRAAQSRVDERISELKAIEAHISSLLRQRDAAAEAQIRSLVKVYERMKPGDAARIFETLDKTILLDVAALMKEQAIAGILAEMQPKAAQDLTERLATRLVLPDEGAGN